MYFLDGPYLCKECGDQIIGRCVSVVEVKGILKTLHMSAVSGHHGENQTASKV